MFMDWSFTQCNLDKEEDQKKASPPHLYIIFMLGLEEQRYEVYIDNSVVAFYTTKIQRGKWKNL